VKNWIFITLVFFCQPVWRGRIRPARSRFHLNIGDESIDARFEMDVLTLLRLIPGLDRNQDLRISLEEAEAGVPRLAEYLAKRVTLDIDGIEVDGWGKSLPVVWPNKPDEPVGMADYGKLLVQFPFQRKIEKRPADVRVTFDVFVEFGGNHRIFGDIGFGETAREQVEFNHYTPDYLFDVVYALRKDRKSGK